VEKIVLEGAVNLAGDFAQEFLLVHVVLEGFVAINENDGDFVVVLTAKVGVGVDVDFAPGKAPAAGELGQTFFDNLAEVTSLARIDDDGTGCWHARRF
jgi:hypothetical protein